MRKYLANIGECGDVLCRITYQKRSIRLGSGSILLPTLPLPHRPRITSLLHESRLKAKNGGLIKRKRERRNHFVKINEKYRKVIFIRCFKQQNLKELTRMRLKNNENEEL